MVHLEEITIINAPLQRCFNLARSVEVHLAGNMHFGEQAVATAGITSGLLNLHDRVTWRAKHFFIWQNLTSEITAMQPPTYFQDTMLDGTFQSMRHEHFFRALPDGNTEMKDDFFFSAPIPLAGPLAEVLFLRSYMQKLLRERNAVIKQIAESRSEWQRYLPPSRSA